MLRNKTLLTPLKTLRTVLGLFAVTPKEIGTEREKLYWLYLYWKERKIEGFEEGIVVAAFRSHSGAKNWYGID